MADEKLEVVITADDRASGVFGGLSGVLGGLGSMILGGLAAAAAAAGAAMYGLGTILKDSVGEAMESQNAIAQLEAVLKSTGGEAGVTKDAVLELASSLQKVTRYSDEQIISGENLLLTFTNIGKDIFPDATQAMLDMSTALGQDLSSSAIQLGKALQDPILGVTALRRVGVNFSDAQRDMIKSMVEAGDIMGAQKFILAELTKEFGGSAVAAGQTFAGAMDILKNRFSEVKEELGMKLIPVITKLMNEVIVPLIPYIEEAATAFGDFLVRLSESDEFKEFIEFVSDGLKGIIQLFEDISSGQISMPAMPDFTEFANFQLPELQWNIAPIPLPNFSEAIDPILNLPEGIPAFFDNLALWWEEHGPVIKQQAEELWDGFMVATDDTSSIVSKFIDDSLVKVTEWLNENGPLIEEFGQLVVDVFTRTVLPSITVFTDNFFTMLTDVMDLLLDLGTLVMQVATGDWAGAWESMKLVAVDALTIVGDFFMAFLNHLASFLGTTMDEVVSQWTYNLDQMAQVNFLTFTGILGVILENIDGIKGAFMDLSEWVGTEFTAIFEAVAEKMDSFRNLLSEPLDLGIFEEIRGVFDRIEGAISSVIDSIWSLGDAFVSLVIPDWLTPGSPTPFEIGLIGVQKALQGVNSVPFPTFPESSPLSASPSSGISTAGSFGAGRAPITLNFTYAPAVSLGSEREMRDRIAPVMVDLLREAQNNGII